MVPLLTLSVGVSSSSTPIDSTNARAQAEEELLSLNTTSNSKFGRTAVLNLAGLYGGERQPANFAKRVCATQEQLEGKGSVHLIHGLDVARAILGVWKARDSDREKQVWNRRWIVSGEFKE